MSANTTYGQPGDAELEQLRQAVERFNTNYASTLDGGDLAQWPDFFTDDAVYVVTARENYDQNLPVGLIYCEGRAMLQDRAFALQNTAMFAPRYLRHFITNCWVTVESNQVIRAGANYLLTQVLLDEPSATIHQVGRYIDRFVESDEKLFLAERSCIYDNTLIDNTLVFPV